jgi:hypothetical protein
MNFRRKVLDYKLFENMFMIMEVIIMTGKRIWRLVFALLIIAGISLGGFALYRMGFAHGAMTNITLPEGGEFPVVPYAYHPLGWHYGPRVGLLGIFPLLCFGGIFFLALMFGFGFMARKRAWMHYYGPGSHPGYWKHHGPPWGPGKPPWEQEQPKAESETPPAETDQTEE